MNPARPARARGRAALSVHRHLPAVCLALLICCTPAGGVFAASCPPDRIDETAVVAYVHDGDTLHLRDGRKLRIIGIDTPELGRDGRRPERFAVAARDRLRELLKRGTEIGLRFDAERRDSYDRLLAHVFLMDGTSVTARLLARGLGTVLPVPPNLWNLECYRSVETEAEERRRGIWSLSRYRSATIADLPPRASGYRVVRGRVDRARLDDRALRLAVADHLIVSISRDDLAFFTGAAEPEYWNGRVVEVRGWLVRRDDGFHMRVRHPVSLRIAE